MDVERDAFNEMTDRELIIKLYAKMKLSYDVSEIKQSLKERPAFQLCSITRAG
jgi:hypothetical protein